MPSAQEFQANYQHMSDEELLCVAADRGELVEDAVIALDAELAKRGLRQGQAQKFRRSVERVKARDYVGNTGLSYRGSGKQFLGASNYTTDNESRLEEFDSTLWAFFAFLPVLPHCHGADSTEDQQEIHILGIWEQELHCHGTERIEFRTSDYDLRFRMPGRVPRASGSAVRDPPRRQRYAAPMS